MEGVAEKVYGVAAAVMMGFAAEEVKAHPASDLE